MRGNKKSYIGFKVSEHEHKIIINKAKNIKTNVSDYVRTVALGKEICHIDGLRELLPELNRIGNNLNQITAAINKGNVRIFNFTEIKTEFATVVNNINLKLKGGEQNGHSEDDKGEER